jgi:hypothetical protein
MITKMKEKLISATGSASGIASVLGSWQVCHNICLGIIASLSVVGITLVGMPLEFFTKIAIPAWSIAILFFAIALGLYIKKKCISKNLLLLNSGLLIAGIPFQQVQQFSSFFLTVGGTIAVVSLMGFVREKGWEKIKHWAKPVMLYGGIGILIGAAIIAIVMAGNDTPSQPTPLNNPQQASTSSFNSIITGTTDDGDVAIELHPIEITENKLIFEISVNTHSVDLSQFDLKKIITLDYNGKTTRPVSAPQLGGHHVFDSLIFTVDETPSSFTVTIESVPKIEKRVFEW